MLITDKENIYVIFTSGFDWKTQALHNVRIHTGIIHVSSWSVRTVIFKYYNYPTVS